MRKAIYPAPLCRAKWRGVAILFLFLPQIAWAYPNYRFNGMPLDAESELYYFGQRYYNADIGRFIQPDPLQNYLVTPMLKQRAGMDLDDVLANPQRLNSYSYGLNNPVNVVDPTGESPFVSKERQERFDQISAYIRTNDDYSLARDKNGNAAALDLIWQRSYDMSKNDKGKADLGKALDTYYDAVNVNWRDNKTLDASREDYLDRIHNLPNALGGQYGGDMSNIDKLQHFVASARMAYKYGGEIALLFGRLKEVHDGLRALFSFSPGYFALKSKDEGYSRGDIVANYWGTFWIYDYMRGKAAPSDVINNME